MKSKSDPSATSFYVGLLLLSAGTLMYEVVLTRLLSVICWYYLAFVSVSMAMFGMTAGALLVHLRPEFTTGEHLSRRLAQSVFAMAASLPVTLVVTLAIPLGISAALQTVFSFVLFAGVIAVPFFFSGIGICISITKMPFPTGRVYFIDLSGAALGCLGAVGLLYLQDAPSAIFSIAALLFVSTAAFAVHARQGRSRRIAIGATVVMLALSALNSSTVHGIQPIWSKGALDIRNQIFAEVWNPISRVRFSKSLPSAPDLAGASPHTPSFTVDAMMLDIDNDASTQLIHFDGNLAALKWFRYDVSSLGAELRSGGTAAIIGVGGGRDVLDCAVNGFKRIVGVEVNPTIVKMNAGKLDGYSGFSKIPGFELHNDEGRSFLTRSPEQFDLIQASLVDTWAATTAGAMTLSENALYTVDGWRVFYSRLKPGGIISFTRWYVEPERSQTYRLVSVAYAMLLSEGVSHPSGQMALIQSGDVATLIVSNQPFNARDISNLKSITAEMGFTPIFFPGEGTDVPEIQTILESKSLADLTSLEDEYGRDYSPTFDQSPYFFNAVHLRELPRFLTQRGKAPNLEATLFLFAFMLAAVVLVAATILLPAWLAFQRERPASPVSMGSILYFVSIGLGFMCIEMAMMQQLSIFLGQPIYSMIVVLTGLILSTGIGSFLSDRWPAASAWQCRVPPAVVALLVVLYYFAVLPATHAWIAMHLWQRILICILLISPPGIALGFCFPIGLRWVASTSGERDLPWMWALNGAAGTLGSFVAMMVSMDSSIGACVLVGATFYLLAAVALPRGRAPLQKILI
jgi:hypothetical protein